MKDNILHALAATGAGVILGFILIIPFAAFLLATIMGFGSTDDIPGLEYIGIGMIIASFLGMSLPAFFWVKYLSHGRTWVILPSAILGNSLTLYFVFFTSFGSFHESIADKIDSKLDNLEERVETIDLSSTKQALIESLATSNFRFSHLRTDYTGKELLRRPEFIEKINIISFNIIDGKADGIALITLYTGLKESFDSEHAEMNAIPQYELIRFEINPTLSKNTSELRITHHLQVNSGFANTCLSLSLPECNSTIDSLNKSPLDKDVRRTILNLF